jgi:hypothetical protein
MADPENHTLHVLREIRDDIRDFRGEVANRFDDVDKRNVAIEADVKNIKQIASGVMRMGAMMAEQHGSRMDDFDDRMKKMEREFEARFGS